MRKLFSLLGRDAPVNGDIGIEIECEGTNLQPTNVGFWKTEDDGSLRGVYPSEKCEYVLKKPIDYKLAEKAIDDIVKINAKAEFKFSFRTSVHIHVNVQSLNRDELLSFIYTYLLFEDVMMKYCGPSRQGNRFCLRVRDAEQQLFPIQDIIMRDLDSVFAIAGDNYRYASMNLASLANYGSIEFRGMYGTVDKKVLLPWINSLINMRSFACKMKNPMTIYRHLAEVGPGPLFLEVFGEEAQHFGYQGMEGDTLGCASLAIQIPFEWEKYCSTVPVPNKKKVNNKRDFEDFWQANPQNLGDLLRARQGAAPNLRGIQPFAVLEDGAVALDEEQAQREPINPEPNW